MSVQQAEGVRTVVSFADPTKAFGVSYGLNRYANDMTYEQKDVEFRNARLVPDEGLATRGFTLIRSETKVTDFCDVGQLEAVYKQEMHDLIRKMTGAEMVIVFHMQLRDNSPKADATIRKPAFFAHIDYTEDTFRIRAREELGEEADHWLGRRMAAFNIWRGVHPVEEKHLALCDARTVRREDFLETVIHERPGEPTPYVGMPLSYNPDQRWYYYPDMQPDEVLVFKQCDSDHDQIQWSPHVAIDDPRSANPRPRVSFEARTLAFF
jgi:hypothetical protein